MKNTKKSAKSTKATTATKKVATTAASQKTVASDIETKGKSKITADEVIAARKMFKANPELTMQEIKDALKLRLSTIMVGRAIRGISHGHIDMCGLPVRPFGTREAKAAKVKVAKTKAPAPKATAKSAKAAAPKKAAKSAGKAGSADPTKFVDIPAMPVVAN